MHLLETIGSFYATKVEIFRNILYISIFNIMVCITYHNYLRLVEQQEWILLIKFLFMRDFFEDIILDVLLLLCNHLVCVAATFIYCNWDAI